MHGNRRRFARRIGSITASVTALLLTLTVAMGFSSAPAQASTAPVHVCTTGSTNRNIETCLYIYGSGLQVTKAVASAAVRTNGRVLRVVLTGPSGPKATMSPAYVGPGDTGQCAWAPKHRAVARGVYQAKTYRQNPNGTYTLVGDAQITLT